MGGMMGGGGMMKNLMSKTRDAVKSREYIFVLE
jgi:hypothetical protein